MHKVLKNVFKCDTCGKGQNTRNLDIHMSTVYNWYCHDCADKMVNPRFICEQCDKNLPLTELQDSFDRATHKPICKTCDLEVF